MKRFLGLILVLVTALLAGSTVATPVLAGERTSMTTFMDSTGALNEMDWNRGDENITCTDGKLVIAGDTSTADTKIISKTKALVHSAVKEMINVSASLRLTVLPKGEKFILAFGLTGVEAYQGDNGNIEVTFENNNGIQCSIIMYQGGEAVELMGRKKISVSMNKEFAFNANITNEGLFTVKINGSSIYSQKLPVSGEGRFGIIQTGNCGAVFTKLENKCSFYDQPQNSNIFEDFEDGEFNTNELVAHMLSSNGLEPVNHSVQDLNGNKVMMFRNVEKAYLSTAQEYSNFELSFDVPYYLRQELYDDNGDCIAYKCGAFAITLGEPTAYPKGASDYAKGIDWIEFGSTYASSVSLKKYQVNTKDLGIFDADSVSDGFSVKLSVIDGHSILQLKKIDAKQWITVAEADYESFRSGYISIWSLRNGNFAIDNFKLENKDNNPNLVEPEYHGSKFVVEDFKYEPSPLVFREDVEGVVEEEKTSVTPILPLVLVSAGSVVVVAVIIVLVLKSKRKKRNGGIQNDKNEMG